jgi:hypothetical protein
MMRGSYHGLMTSEDRLTYRKWIRPIAVAYGSVALFIMGVAIMRLNHQSNHDTAKQDPRTFVSVADHSNRNR